MQRLLDETAVVACMVYVDLSPIRAGVAPTPETSQFTSVYERIQATLEECRESPPRIEPAVSTPTTATWPEDRDLQVGTPPTLETPARRRAEWLSPLDISTTLEQQPGPVTRASNKGCLEMSLAAYLELLEWSGEQWRRDKQGSIAQSQPDILLRLGLLAECWMQMLRGFHGRFRRAAGSLKKWRRRPTGANDGGSRGSERAGKFSGQILHSAGVAQRDRDQGVVADWWCGGVSVVTLGPPVQTGRAI